MQIWDGVSMCLIGGTRDRSGKEVCFPQERENCSGVSNSLGFHALYPERLLCSWNSPGKNTRVGVPIARGSSQPRGWTLNSCMTGSFLTSEPPGKPRNTGIGSLSLLQGICPTQESNRGVLHCRLMLYMLRFPGLAVCKYGMVLACAWLVTPTTNQGRGCVFLGWSQSERCTVVSNSLGTHGYTLTDSCVHGILQARILEWEFLSPGDLPNP